MSARLVRRTEREASVADDGGPSKPGSPSVEGDERGSYDVHVEVELLSGSKPAPTRPGTLEPSELACLVVAPTTHLRSYIARGLVSTACPELSILYAGSAGEATARATMHKPALMVVDVDTDPADAGALLVRALRDAAETPTKVLLLVDRVAPGRASRLLQQSGADRLLGKPFNLTSLAREACDLITGS